MIKRKTPEGYVLEAVMDYLAAKHIWHRRMNIGAVKTEKRFIRYGSVGMTDVLAIFTQKVLYVGKVALVYWIECKAPNGKQSAAQKTFQAEVEAEGMVYILARSVEDVRKYL